MGSLKWRRRRVWAPTPPSHSRPHRRLLRPCLSRCSERFNDCTRRRRVEAQPRRSILVSALSPSLSRSFIRRSDGTHHPGLRPVSPLPSPRLSPCTRLPLRPSRRGRRSQLSPRRPAPTKLSTTSLASPPRSCEPNWRGTSERAESPSNHPASPSRRSTTLSATSNRPPKHSIPFPPPFLSLLPFLDTRMTSPRLIPPIMCKMLRLFSIPAKPNAFHGIHVQCKSET